MRPLRTGLSEGAFCVLGDCRGDKCRSLGFARDDNLLGDDSFLGMTICRGETQGLSTSHQVRFRESDAALGMTNFGRDDRLYLVMELGK